MTRDGLLLPCEIWILFFIVVTLEINNSYRNKVIFRNCSSDLALPPDTYTINGSELLLAPPEFACRCEAFVRRALGDSILSSA